MCSSDLSGSGAAAHLAAELFKTMAGVDMVHVPYKGAQPALTAVIAGQAQLMFATSASVIPYVKAGRLRALAVTPSRRSAVVPDLPALSEAGAPTGPRGVAAGPLAGGGGPRRAPASPRGTTPPPVSTKPCTRENAPPASDASIVTAVAPCSRACASASRHSALPTPCRAELPRT